MDYTVVPVGVLDASHATDSVILIGWVLDKPIDSLKMENAWATLVNAWPLLVSRLRRDPKTQRWEYHIPNTVSTSGSFATTRIGGSIHSHYNYAKPSTTLRCTVKENPYHLFLPQSPKSVDYMLKNDVPLMHMNITIFDDASLIGLYTPHILCDGHGIKAIMTAFCKILSGGAPPEPLHLEDPYEHYAINESTVPAPPYWRSLSSFQTLQLYARSLWDWFTEGTIENREIFFSPSEIARLKAEAMDDIERKFGRGTDNWVSSSDAVLAHCLKCTHAHNKTNFPFNVFYTANVRPLMQLPEPFLHNSVNMVITPTLPVSRVSTMPLGELALHIRRTLIDQNTPESIETFLRWRLQNAKSVKTFWDPWKGYWNIVTNARDMKLMDFDFTPALSDDTFKGTSVIDSDAQQRQVNCVYLWGNGYQRIPLRSWLGLWADHPEGGIWMSGFLPKYVWENKDGYGKYIRND